MTSAADDKNFTDDDNDDGDAIDDDDDDAPAADSSDVIDRDRVLNLCFRFGATEEDDDDTEAEAETATALQDPQMADRKTSITRSDM